MSAEEPRYTLAEARRIFGREECAVNGHSFAHIITGYGDLLRVTCTSCDASWSVTPDRRAEQ